MIADYCKALIPEPYYVLGCKLTSFTLGHYVVLNRIESPLVREGEPITPADVILGTLVCSQTWRENVDMLAGDIGEAMRRFMRRDWLWWIKVPRIRWKATTELFVEWYQQAIESPVTYSEASGSKLSAPWIEGTYTLFSRHLGMTFEQVMDMPIPVCVYRSVAITEALGGSTRLESENERELRLACQSN